MALRADDAKIAWERAYLSGNRVAGGEDELEPLVVVVVLRPVDHEFLLPVARQIVQTVEASVGVVLDILERLHERVLNRIELCVVGLRAYVSFEEALVGLATLLAPNTEQPLGVCGVVLEFLRCEVVLDRKGNAEGFLVQVERLASVIILVVGAHLRVES